MYLQQSGEICVCQSHHPPQGSTTRERLCHTHCTSDFVLGNLNVFVVTVELCIWMCSGQLVGLLGLSACYLG